MNALAWAGAALAVAYFLGVFTGLALSLKGYRSGYEDGVKASTPQLDGRNP